MMKIRFVPCLILSLAGSLLVAGCRTSRPSVAPSTTSLKAEEAFFHALQEQTFQYQTLSARMQFEMEMPSGKTFSSRVNLKIRKDERMQFSVLPILGIEAFRIELSPDSLLVIDRLNKRYLSESVTRIRKETRAGFNFYSMQALFTNRLFLPDEADVPDRAFKRFRWERTADGYALQTQDDAGLQYLFTVGRDEKLYASEITDAGSQHMLRWNYDAFQPVGRQVFPMKIHAGWRTGEKAGGRFAVNYSRMDTDVPVEVNTTIPAGYERVDFSQIRKMFE